MADYPNPEKWIHAVLSKVFPGRTFKDIQRVMPDSWIQHNVTSGSIPLRGIFGGNNGVIIHCQLRSYSLTSIDAFNIANKSLIELENAVYREEEHHGIVPIEYDTRQFPTERYKPNVADTILGYQFECSFQIKFVFE